MIKTLEIKNFKSIKHLKVDCKKVNVFIGEPNTGKSNILESIGIFSLPFGMSNPKDFVRFENMSDLFCDHDIAEIIEITGDNIHCEVRFDNRQFSINANKKGGELFTSSYDYAGVSQGGRSGGDSPVKFYRFGIINTFPIKTSDFLRPLRGGNLLSILLTNKSVRKLVADIFNNYGFRIVLKPQEDKIEIQKEIEDVIISHPYSLVSDTLQRLVFHLVAIETNKDSIIIFEEPEAHAFPFYTKFLAERIALDKTNQYFISTHNPYFLLPLLAKTSKGDIGIYITYLKDYQTKVRPFSEEEMPELFDLDASLFFNLDKFLEQEDDLSGM